jgi:hypothetical protein
VEKLGGSGAQARREGKKRRGRSDEKRRGSPPIVGAGGASGRWQRAVTTGLMAFKLSYSVFMPKPSTHCMHDPGSNVPHIRPKVLIDNQMS